VSWSAAAIRTSAYAPAVSSTPAAARLQRVLPELYSLTPIEEFPARTLALVNALIGCDKSDYAEVDTARGEFHVLVLPEPSQLRALSEARRAHMHQHPTLRHFLRNDDPAPRLISDVLRPKEFHRLGLYGEFFRPLGVEDQLTVAITGPSSGRPAAISAHRGQQGFDDEDRALFSLLRPHLIAAHENAVRFSVALSGQSRSVQPNARAALARLTERQLAILAQLSTGRTNSQIASALDISPGTVRKHLEHILQRLGLPTRTAAAVCYVNGTHALPDPTWTAHLPAPLTPIGHLIHR
jgi:DNA-binding CsgD family transcriptional regulator